LISRLYAHTFPEEVAGMVLADPSHEDQAQRLGTKGKPLLMNVFRLGPALVRSRIPALFPGVIPVPGGDQLSEQDRRAFRALIVADPRYTETVKDEMGQLEETFAKLRRLNHGLGDIRWSCWLMENGDAPVSGYRLRRTGLAGDAATGGALDGRAFVVGDGGHEIPSPARPDDQRNQEVVRDASPAGLGY
jgi:pimeloyl-ACP methyl ester carboxylesterase